MFTLRFFHETAGMQQNYNLGDNYTKIEKSTSGKMWKEYFPLIDEDTHTAIKGGDYGNYFVSKGDYAHIMTENGKVYDDLTETKLKYYFSNQL